MELLKRIISSLLIVVTLFSSIGVQGFVNHCKGCSGEQSIIFLENPDESNACCSSEKEDDDCCRQKASKHDAETNFVNTKCCTQNSFYFKLSVDTILQEYKHLFFNTFDFNIFFIEFGDKVFNVKIKPHILPPLLEFNLGNGKRLPILFSQIII